MILKRISVKNFRSCRDAVLDVGVQMAIVGGNGAGKSTVLRAVERFYGQSTTVEIDDFYGKNVADPIEIGLTFTGFSELEESMFSSRIHEGEMTVVRIFEPSGGKTNGRYFGATRQHPPFVDVRAAANATAQRALYNALRTQDGDYASLPAVTRADQIPEALALWEAANEGKCALGRDDGQFFGFTNVARGALQRATSFVFIPAVRDASADALDSRGAVIARLMELVVRNAIQQRTDIRNFQSRVTDEYRELTDPSKLKELGGLSEALTETLQQFYKEAAVALQWQPVEDFAIPMPTAHVLLDDDGFEGPVDRKGHGLQRALILTLLQHLAKATSAAAAFEANTGSPTVAEEIEPAEVLATSSSTTLEAPSAALAPYTLPGLILAIEEPELYQHPTKQRHFAKVLSELSAGQLAGVARETQVLFATHSALFVSMDRFEEVRLARRRNIVVGGFKECELTSSTLAQVARKLEKAHSKPEGTYTAEGLRPRLHIINSEIAEGFFADAVVLVEGVSDRAALIASASLQGIDLEAMGIAILWVDGKSKLDRPAAIFTSLNVPTYVVWDCDRKTDGTLTDEDAKHNRALQILMGVAPDEASDALNQIAGSFACFERKLESTLEVDIGHDLYQELIANVKAKYGIERNEDVEKAPFAMRELLTSAASLGKTSEMLGMIVRAVVDLRDSANATAVSS